MFKQFLRTLHVASPVRSSTKSDLAKLRKVTGYSFANCKKALEVNNNDVILAEKWLKEQAQALGWSKATKLEGRATMQGLIGVSLKNDSATLVEVNCETDFVARNKTFKSFVDSVTSSCLKRAVSLGPAQQLQKISIETDEMKKMSGAEGKSLADLTALTISSVGENITLRRATLVKAPKGMFLSACTHPPPDNHSVKVFSGKYGSVVAYRANDNNEEVRSVAKQLCQHVVGMNPLKVGQLDEDEPLAEKDDETTMIHQEFLLDPTQTVSEFIDTSGVEVVDFVRFECGEKVESEQPSVVASQAG